MSGECLTARDHGLTTTSPSSVGEPDSQRVFFADLDDLYERVAVALDDRPEMHISIDEKEAVTASNNREGRDEMRL
ncbi:hypothetical protein A3748_09445 [Erythrobacter sp. HI0077]|nr:hypothetical protein A3748_09445 [Erythrobacter sp. HI0077]